ncbi:MAG: histidine kinase, partial [Kibdelosporangium sp.]
MGTRGSLARQLLAWQVVIVLALLGTVAVYSMIQSNENFGDVEGRRMLSAAETLAANDGVRLALTDPMHQHTLPTFAEG